MKKIKLKLRNIKEKKIIWNKFRCYIDCVILACCLVIVFNISSNINIENNNIPEKTTMKYVFHDYEWNTYILNDSVHGTSVSLDYLSNKEVPDAVKNETKDWQWSVSLADVTNHQGIKQENENTQVNNNVSENENIQENNNVKDNQITIDEIIQELGTDWNSGNIVIDLDNLAENTDNDSSYTVTENSDWTVMIITKNDEECVDVTENPCLIWKIFTYVIDGYVQPILIPRDQLPFNGKAIAYIDDTWNINGKKWVTIIDEYADCMTPRWYTIIHWDSVLAYQQRDDAPDICNIERRFCWNWKLSGTYRQQWCSVNTNYTYAQWWEAVVTVKEPDVIPDTVQNPDWRVTVNDKEVWSSFVFDRPSQKSTPGYYRSDNVVTDEEVDQTKRPHRDCTAPRWERVKHWQLVQAFKHANWFSDAPCQAQIRICTNGDLIWSYTQPTCKTRDTSFIDRINWSPTWETYSREKLEWVRDLIEAEQNYDIDYHRPTYIDQLDEILSMLDE